MVNGIKSKSIPTWGMIKACSALSLTYCAISSCMIMVIAWKFCAIYNTHRYHWPVVQFHHAWSWSSARSLLLSRWRLRCAWRRSGEGRWSRKKIRFLLEPSPRTASLPPRSEAGWSLEREPTRASRVGPSPGADGAVQACRRITLSSTRRQSGSGMHGAGFAAGLHRIFFHHFRKCFFLSYSWRTKGEKKGFCRSERESNIYLNTSFIQVGNLCIHIYTVGW